MNVAERLAQPLALARLLRKAGTPKENAGPRIQAQYSLTDAEIHSILVAIWGK